jgi:cytochrome c556
MMKQTLSIGLLALMLTPLGAIADGSENAIKYRQAMMKAIGGHMSASSLIVRGKVSHQADLKGHASALKQLSTDIPRLFPEDSDFGETHAKPEIWERWDDFAKAADTFKASAAKFQEVVESGNADNIKTAYKNVGKSCKGCHKDFREKHEH